MKQISKITIVFGLFIIISATFMRQVVDCIKVRIGERGFVFLIELILVGAGFVFMIITIRNYPGLWRTVAIGVVLCVGLIFVWQMKITVEKIHILEYGILGWLAGRDLLGKEKRMVKVIPTIIFIGLVSILDELYQAVLPYRYFDFRDIWFNGLGGTLGIVLYSLGIVK
ncbi:MAG: VanZ family protein [Candidatus Omnitrophica bacterium]|nr:VanZ family protein [Candidatus Omnitrophota bacterium]